MAMTNDKSEPFGNECNDGLNIQCEQLKHLLQRCISFLMLVASCTSILSMATCVSENLVDLLRFKPLFNNCVLLCRKPLLAVRRVLPLVVLDDIEHTSNNSRFCETDEEEDIKIGVSVIVLLFN